MPTRSWYPWYPADYLVDTLQLDLEHDGAYRRILDQLFMNGPIELSENLQEISKILRTNSQKTRRIFEALSEYFHIENGILDHKRIAQLRAHAHEKSKKRAIAGRQGGLAKARGEKSTASLAKAEAYARVPEPDIDPSLRSGSFGISDEIPRPLNGSQTGGSRVSAEDIRDVLRHLNDTTGSSFRWRNPKGQPTAHARTVHRVLKAGYTVAQCKQVVESKFQQWGTDEKMIQYLRPETLFRLSKFEQYLDQA